jgi:glyoxylase-like metal-dependent hydrolase (beta-lactamase superfamily II)
VTAPTIAALECGWLTTQERTLVDGGSTDLLRIPIPAWLVRHHRGEVVFDAGLVPALVDDAAALGRYAKYFTADMSAADSVASRLTEHDVDPDSAITVVVSHCHFDHVGGLSVLPNARIVVHADEWREAMSDDRTYDRDLFDLGHDVLAVDGGHDLFGDGTVVTLPTPGHTCGHQSLRVETADGPTILTGDACYFTHTLDDEVLPPFGFDLDQQRRSLALLRAERDRGVRIVPGHDAAAMRALQHP